MGERASSHSDIAALKPRFRQISYASGVFFTLAMHRRLLTNFFLGRFHLGLGPSLHRLSPQQPHFLDNPSASLRFSPEFATAMAIDANRSRRPGCASRIAENASSLSFAAAICQASLDSRIDSISSITLNRTLDLLAMCLLGRFRISYGMA